MSGLQAVVLCGGLATRMLPRTLDVPKYLLPVRGRPFAAWQLERLRASGFGRVVLCVGHLGEAIRACVGDGSAFGVGATYVDEGPTRLGTGGVLSLAKEAGALDEAFLVTYGDSYLPFDYASPLDRLGREPSLDGVMSVYRNEGRLGASNVALSDDGARVALYDKRCGEGAAGVSFIDYGAIALRGRAIPGRRGAYGLEEVLGPMAAEGRLGALVAGERFYEIGSPEGLVALEAAIGGLPLGA